MPSGFKRLCVLMALVCSGSAVNAQTLKYGYFEFPPYFYTVNNKPVGQTIDMLNYIMKDIGYNYSAESLSGRRLIDSISKGTLDLTILISTPEAFRGTTVISKAPVTRIILMALGKKERPVVSSFEDLKNKSIIGFTGYTYGGMIEFLQNPDNKITYTQARTVEQGINLILANRGDYLLNYKEHLDVALIRQPTPGLRMDEVSRLDTYFILSNKVPDAEIVMGKLEAALARAQAAGFITAVEADR